MEYESLYNQLFVDYVPCKSAKKSGGGTSKDLNQNASRATFEEMRNYINSNPRYNSIAGRMRTDVILIDVDNHDGTGRAEAYFDRLLSYLELTPAIIKTEHGKHYYFRCDKDLKIKQSNNRLNLYGIPFDKKKGSTNKDSGAPNACGIVYQFNEYREILSAPSEISIAPFELIAILDTDSPLYDIAEGERNGRLFSEYKHLYKNAGATKEQALECLEVATQCGIIQGTPMERSELESIFRDYDELKAKRGRKKSELPHPADIADEIIEKYNLIRLDGYSDKLNLYRYVDNYYKRIEHPNELFALIKKTYRYTRLSIKNEIIHNIKIEESINRERNNDLIAFNNGIINTASNSLELLPHDPDYIVTNKIPFDFCVESQAYDMSEIKPLLNALDLWTNHDKDLEKQLYNIFGYCLTSSCALDLFFIFTGIGSNGKSSFMKFAEYIIPKTMRSALSPKQISDRFSTVDLENKLVNFCHDTNLKTWSNDMSDRIKLISSGETIHVDEKNVSPRNIQIFAKLIFNMNRLPKSEDTSDGFTRRIIIVPFEHHFVKAEKDENLLAKLCKPNIASYFLSNAVRIYQEELNNPDNPDNFFISDKSKQA